LVEDLIFRIIFKICPHSSTDTCPPLASPSDYGRLACPPLASPSDYGRLACPPLASPTGGDTGLARSHSSTDTCPLCLLILCL